ncbi:MAG: GAF domain-containing protein [Candidatus Eremiobacterota bacterium]
MERYRGRLEELRARLGAARVGLCLNAEGALLLPEFTPSVRELLRVLRGETVREVVSRGETERIHHYTFRGVLSWSVIGCPIRADGEVVGALMVERRRNEGEFGPEALAVLEQAAALLP